MKQWYILLQKELLEMWRNFKWIWVPITFILLGVQAPITSYFLPQILDSFGGLPKGVEIPIPSAEEVLVKGLSEYTQIGIIIIVLMTMGILAGERKSGVAAMILVKPVSYKSFVIAKWAGSILLVWGSFFIGYLATWYYTGILFKWVPISDFFITFFIYGLWFTLVISITFLFSATFKIPGMAGFSSIAVVIILNVATSILSHWLKWSPAQITDDANQLLLTKEWTHSLLPTSIITTVSIIVLLMLSIFIFRKKELS